MEAMETEFETSRHYMQAEMGRTRDDLEKMRDKFRRLATFIQYGCIELIKSDSKDFYSVTKNSLLNMENTVLLNFIRIL